MATKRITVSIDEGLYNLARLSTKNASQYVAQLITADITMKQVEPLYDRVSNRLLVDSEWIELLRGKLSSSRAVPTVVDDVSYEPMYD